MIMINIALKFTYHTDIISVPEEIGKKIKKYQILFDKWLYNKNSKHENWILRNGRKVAVSFDTKTFVDYINEYHTIELNEKAYIVEKHCDTIPSNVIMLYF